MACALLPEPLGRSGWAWRGGQRIASRDIPCARRWAAAATAAATPRAGARGLGSAGSDASSAPGVEPTLWSVDHGWVVFGCVRLPRRHRAESLALAWQPPSARPGVRGGVLDVKVRGR
jgi:hypothetical protein